MKKIKLLLAEDHHLVRSGIRSLLEKEMDLEIICETDNGRDAVKLTKKLNPDVVLMDIGLPTLNGIEATFQINKYAPESKVLILTMHETDEYISKLLQAGAAGYLIKRAVPTELVSAIHAVDRGECYLSPQITQTVVDKFVNKSKDNTKIDKFSLLTEREREILQLIAEGYKNKEIADILYISKKTVETHRTHLMDKLDLHNIAEITQYAIRKGIIC